MYPRTIFIELDALQKVTLYLFALCDYWLKFEFQAGHQSERITQWSGLFVYFCKIIMILLIECLHHIVGLFIELQTYIALRNLILTPYITTQASSGQQTVPSQCFAVFALHMINLTYYVPKSPLILEVIISD